MMDLEHNPKSGSSTWDLISAVSSDCLKYATMYTAIHLICDFAIIRNYVSKDRLSKLSRADRIYITEKICSSLNGAVAGVSAIYLIFLQSGFTGEYGVFTYYPRVLDTLFSSYVGYTIYDMGTMALAGNEPIEMWLHHIFGLIGATGIMFYRKAAYFPLYFLSTEITVLLVNLVWYLRTFEVKKDSVLYTMSTNARNVLFLFIRALIVPFCLTNAVMQMNEKNFFKKLNKYNHLFSLLPSLLKYGIAFNVTALGALNLYWIIVMGGNALKKQKKQ